tara:strand:+ start:3674 stop:3922 length:249 start_codon:yes stop_codon:yes gene_type:complete
MAEQSPIEITVLEFPDSWKITKEMFKYIKHRSIYELAKLSMAYLKDENPSEYNKMFGSRFPSMKEYVGRIFPEQPSFSRLTR